MKINPDQLRVLFIQRHVMAPVLAEDLLAYKLFKAYADYFQDVYIIGQSPNSYFHYWAEGNLQVWYLPQTVGQWRRAVKFVCRAFLRARKIHKEWSLSVVSGADLLGGIAGLLMKYCYGIPFVLQLQGQFFEPSSSFYGNLRAKGSATIARFLCRRADVIRCVSAEIMRAAVKHGIDRTCMRVVPSRCDVELFDPIRWCEKGQEVRHQLGLDRKNVLLYVGSLIPLKGVDLLLEAIPIIVQRHPDTVLLIVGDGPQKTALESKVKKLRISRNVQFVGHVSYNQVPQYMAASDIFVFPSLSEAMPRAVLEAMAMELPVIASAVGGITEAVVDGKTGKLVRKGGSVELGSEVSYLLMNPSRRIDWGKAGRLRVIQNYEFKLNIQQMALLHYKAISEIRATEPC